MVDVDDPPTDDPPQLEPPKDDPIPDFTPDITVDLPTVSTVEPTPAEFMALCLLQTLRAIAREHAPGLTPRQIIDKFRTVKMVDVVMPTTDGRIVTLPRSVEPKQDLAILLDRLGLTLPAQPPPKISGEAVDAGKTEV